MIPKNVITRSLGLHPEVQVDLEGPFAVQPGDTLLLCTDGLSGQVSDEELGAVLSVLAPEEATEALVNLANLRGGPDNITVIVAKVTGPQVARPDGGGAEGSDDLFSPQPVHPAIWGLLGLFGVATATLLALGYVGWALLGLVGLGVSAILAVAQRSRVPRSSPEPAIQRSGKGPYVACNCTPDGRFVECLAQMVDELQQTAHHQSWQLDWDQFHGRIARAAAAQQAADHARAAGEYLRAINLMMRELKQRRPSGGESVLEP